MTITIEPARGEDLEAILRLLEGAGLTRSGFAEHVAMALVAREGTAVVGCAALELYGPAALLRSVAVHQQQRGQGLGQRLTAAALQSAGEHSVQDVYLLTETAADFFPRLGFQLVARDAIPAAVRQSVEFTSACPASALAMYIRVQDTGDTGQGPRDRGHERA